MKKLLILSLALTMTLAVHAQREPYSISLRTFAGVNFTNINKISASLSPKTKAGLLIGAEWEYQMDRTFAISGGLNYSQQGFKTNGGNIGLDYLTVPILFHAYFLHGFGIHAGIQAGVNIKDHKLVEDNVSKLNAGVVAGASYEYKNIMLGVRYTADFAATSIDDGVKALRNNGFSVTLGYRFELFKRKLKENKTDNHIVMPSLDI